MFNIRLLEFSVCGGEKKNNTNYHTRLSTATLTGSCGMPLRRLASLSLFPVRHLEWNAYFFPHLFSHNNPRPWFTIGQEIVSSLPIGGENVAFPQSPARRWGKCTKASGKRKLTREGKKADTNLFHVSFKGEYGEHRTAVCPNARFARGENGIILKAIQPRGVLCISGLNFRLDKGR